MRTLNVQKMRKASARTMPDRWTVKVNPYLFEDPLEFEERLRNMSERFRRAMNIKHGKKFKTFTVWRSELLYPSYYKYTFEVNLGDVRTAPAPTQGDVDYEKALSTMRRYQSPNEVRKTLGLGPQ